MVRKTLLQALGLLCLVSLLAPSYAVSIRLNRDFGTSMGGKIKGTFSAKVSAEGATLVEFFLDGEPVASDTEEPFKWTFKTADYPEGDHTIEAVAYFESGTEKASIQKTFVTSFGPWFTLFLIGVFAITGVSVTLSIWWANKERKAPAGKTKCPQCETVFDRKWSAMHKGSAYRNTCPVCAKTFWAKRIEGEEGTDSSQ
jgi:ssDNA-binding Zn-finger/Zn-ribbon topoisomerase 1